MKHQHYKQVAVACVVRKKFVCHAKEGFTFRVLVKQETSVVLQLVKCVSYGDNISANGKRIYAGEVLKIIFVAREGLFVGIGSIGCIDCCIRGGNVSCILIETAFHLFGKQLVGVGTMVFTKFQGTPVLKVVNFSICRGHGLVRGNM